MAVSAQLARALYDNTAESPEELSFKRGDVLRVLQGEGAGGLQGWCLCSLHGQQGIVPANRVKLLPTGPSPESSLYQVPPTRQSTPDAVLGPGHMEQEVYVIPPPPRPCSDPKPSPGSCPPSPDAIYKVPRSSVTQTDAPGETREVYDVPPTALRVPPNDPYDSPVPFPRPLARASTLLPGGDDAPYDVPPALKPSPEPDLEWEGGREPEPPLYAAPSNLKRASALLNLYEAPEELMGEGTSTSSDEAIYDVPLLGPEEPPPPRAPSPPGSNPTPNDLETLALLLARSPPPPPRPRLPSTESLSRRPLPALPVQELSVPSPVPSPASGRKGSIQDRPLPPPPPRLPSYMGLKTEGDEEGRVGDAGAGTADHHNEYEGIPLGEEYDYVHLKGMERVQGSDPPDGATPGVPEPMLPERLLQEEQETPTPGEPLDLPSGDLQLLHFYAGQCQSHYSALQAAVAALLASTRANHPPRLFVPHSKRVVVAAHRLVFVGDTLGRLAASAPLRAQVGTAGAALGQALRAAVLAVKGAALGYPSGPAAREMSQRVAELAGQALQFTTLLSGLAP
ncbi:embryonal Fyn-associated substrate isoform X1 [Dromiciops gliroides]|uniref:embryonal Fyn-associated substrate isoform X1 n=1 Tax=Dromiciops gliroides TaxID=33562 RepID=UPI001CC6587A|nr:embryonal Fyn-associated substrate isoform X1 [Dromiciops gliroides]XP_043846064.1 embryonal Fyn-associated substrate isoform X1 [Dromiciops gliroides]XP_043846065.1 embryonal Fyn-associated substrate isoform X1 [Dromiciops gliroides]XP_043846066.1 embryonal Fyn-associated substrate isoform X1 [Dromiciops gliroides]